MKTVFNMLVLLALLLQGFIPMGYMPSAENGKVAVVICSGSGGNKTIYLDKDQIASSHETVDHEQEDMNTCPYQLVQSSFTFDTPVFAFQDSEIKAYEPSSKQAGFIAYLLIHHNQSRGPPTSFL